MPSDGAGPLAENFARILSERASFELREEDVHAYRRRLSSLQHAVQVSAAARAQEDEEYRQWQAQYPALLDSFEEFAARAGGKRVAVFLDYDGTLTPIVKNPDRAFMSDQMREAVRKVARLFPTAIISGRGREKVEGFVRLKELYYAGSHGMDIIGPRGDGDEDGSALAFQPAARFGPVMDQVYADLTARVAGIEGAAVEHNKFCVSVHFRNCAPGAHEAVLGAVEVTLRAHAELHATRGRKVFEIRPQVDWDKGSAVLHLLSALGLGATDDCLPIYIGDDRTDEDAFRALARAPHPGIGILVSSKVKPTQAAYTLRDPHEVHAFLQRLVAWGRSPANGWHAQPACIGWALNMDPLPPCQEHTEANGGGNGIANGSHAPDTNGGASGEGLHMLPNPFAGTKFAAFGLPAPRGVRDPTAAAHQKSPTVRGGRPPLAPSPLSPSSSSASALDGLGDLRALPSGAAAPPSDPCSPTAPAVPPEEEAPGEPQAHTAVDLSSLSVDDADEGQIARLLTAAGAASLSGAHGLTPAAISKLTAGLEGTPFSAVSAAHDVLAGLGLPRVRDSVLGSESGRSGTFSRGYSSGGESLHFSHSGPLTADGEPETA